MAIKLKSALPSLHLPLAFKAGIFAVFLALVKLSGFSLWVLPVFLIFALFFYFKPLFQTMVFIMPFGIFLIIILLFMNQIPAAYIWPAAAVGGALFYILIGVKNFIFIDRQRVYYIFNLVLFYLAFLMLFWFPKEPFFIIKLILIFILSAFLFGQILKYRRPVVNSVLAFLLTQLVLAISFLPIGFFQSANLALLLTWAMSDLALAYFKKELSGSAVLRKAALFAILAVLILAASKWNR
jgi:hypothetical protein